MPCLLVLVIAFFPRIVLIFMWLTGYLGRAFHHGLLLPVLGFIFLPLTTIVYAWEINNALPLVGINLVWLVLAAVIDISGWGGSGVHARRRYY